MSFLGWIGLGVCVLCCIVSAVSCACLVLMRWINIEDGIVGVLRASQKDLETLRGQVEALRAAHRDGD